MLWVPLVFPNWKTRFCQIRDCNYLSTRQFVAPTRWRRINWAILVLQLWMTLRGAQLQKRNRWEYYQWRCLNQKIGVGSTKQNKCNFINKVLCFIHNLSQRSGPYSIQIDPQLYNINNLTAILRMLTKNSRCSWWFNQFVSYHITEQK